MKYRLHLTESIREPYNKAKAELPPHRCGHGARVCGHVVGEDETGSLFVEISDLSPNVHLALAPFAERVTAKERIYAGFRTEGKYELKYATLWLKNSHEETGDGFNVESRDCQDVEITAPNMEAARDIYEQVRIGKLAPTLNFETGGL